MPERIQIGGNTIDYVYAASGVKQSVKHTPVNGDAVTRSYSGNKVYENGNLKMILTEEGYVEKEGGSFNHYYYLKDHLGNNRVVLDASGNIVQSTEYYPFGAHYTKSTSQEKQPYKFGGKELDHLFDLDCYDFEARMYDPVLGRFMTMDPLAEKYYSISPYAYCNNNPVNVIDPTGMDTLHLTGEGRVQFTQSGGEDIYVVDEPLSTVTIEGKDLSVYGSKPVPYTHMGGNLYSNGSFVRLGSEFGPVIGETPLQNVYPEFDLLLIGSGIVDIIGNGAVKGSSSSLRTVEDIISNPNLLEGKSLSEVQNLLKNTSGWVEGALTKGRKAGQGWTMRQLNSRGTDFTDLYIQYSPGSPRHFGGKFPYWKVSSGNNGTQWFKAGK